MFFRRNKRAKEAAAAARESTATGTALIPTASRGGVPALTGSGRGAPTILGSDLMITGDVTADGHLLIDGRIQGGVEARMVTLGRDGEINGRIEADEVVLHGLVRGSVHARRVHLIRGCRVFADIHHDVLQIDEGAYLEGAIRRLSGSDVLTDPLAAREHDA
jgi:cytoskeletal protein CcmA (bactofilin family)